jgi:Nucleoside diphosphate kinase
VTGEVPVWLADPEKLARYAGDIAFREGIADLAQAWGDEYESLLRRVGWILFKPESLLTRRLEEALDHLRSLRFEPLAWRLVRLDRNVVRGMWRFELARASLPLLAAVDVVATVAPSLLVVLLDLEHGGAAWASATTRLAAVKGSPRGQEQQPGQLRHALRSPTLLLNFVHAPDATADLVRELAVLFDARERADLLAEVQEAASNRRGISTDAAVAAAYESVPPHRLDFDESFARLRAAAPEAPETAAIAELVNGRAPPSEERLLRLIRWLDVCELPLSRPDRGIVAAHLLNTHPRPEGPVPSMRSVSGDGT